MAVILPTAFNLPSWLTTAKSLQSCPTLCDPIDSSSAGSPVPGILQARTLEWVALSFSKAWKWKLKVKSFSRVWPSATPWTAAFQAPPSTGFSRQEYWSGVPLPSTTIMLSTLKINMLLNCGVGEDSWESLELQGDPTSPFWRRSALGFLWKEWC